MEHSNEKNHTTIARVTTNWMRDTISSTRTNNHEQMPCSQNYSREQLAQAAIELDMLPNESQLSMMLSDYSKLRDACRVAEKKLKSMYRPKRHKESEQEIYTKGG